MIVAERKEKTILDKFDRFGEAILLSKKLGRPLSAEEMKKFEV